MKIKKAMLFLISILLIVTMSFRSMAYETDKSSDEEIISTIKDIILKFYENKDLGTHHSMREFMDNELIAYLDDKSNTHNYVSDLYDFRRENYSVQINLIDMTSDNKELLVRFQVITTYSYAGHEDVTTVSEEVRIVYDKEKQLITDFYCPYNYYDVAVRGEAYTKPKSLSGISNQNIIKRREELRQSINRVYLEESSM